MLSTAVSDHPFEWEHHLQRLCFAYNTSIHPNTGYSPFSLMFGRQARMLVDIMLGTSTATTSTIPQYVANLRTNLETAYSYVRNRMGHQLEQQKIHYDERVNGRPYKSGDLVWLHNPAIPRGRSKKLHRPWTGPYRIITKLSDAMYRLQHTHRRRKRPIVHFDRLKPCSPDTRLPQRDKQHSPAVQSSHCPPVGLGLELLDEDFDSAPQTGASTDTPLQGRPPLVDPSRDDPVTPVPDTLPDNDSDLPSEPSLLSIRDTSHHHSSPPARYPQRERSAHIRLYATINQ